MTELKPCPFCGKEVKIEETQPDINLVECLRNSHIEYYIECPCGAGMIDEEKEDLVERWNTRTSRKHTGGMSSGLDDIQGSPIFEGDIMSCRGDKNDLAIAEFGNFRVIDVNTCNVVDEVIGWHYKPIQTDKLSEMEPFCLEMPLTEFYIETCRFEVIGNIWDNTELIVEDDQ